MSLSDKILKNKKAKRLKKDDLRPNDYLYVEHVREAVKELKILVSKEKEIWFDEASLPNIINCIDEIFGEKLI